MEWPPTIFNVTELPTIFNSSGFIDTNSSMFNDSFPNVNSTSVGSGVVAGKRHCQLVLQMSLLALLFLVVFFVSSNKWRTIKYCLMFALLYVVQLFAHAVSWCLGCCQCYGCRPRPSNDLTTSNNDLIEPTEVVVTGGGPGKGQLNVIDLVEAPPSFAAAHEAIHLQGLENVNLHHCGKSGVETKKIANQENVLVHKINEEKQMMNTIEEEDEHSKELVETDVNKLPMGSLDKEKINKMSIEWEMMKILDRANKMEIEDEEKRLEFGISKNTETVNFTNKENVITNVEYKEPMNTIDEDVLTKENVNVEFGKRENVTKNSHESELMNVIEAEDRIQKKTEGKDNLGFDLQEEGEVMKTFDKELENIDIEGTAMVKESQMSPLNLSKDENMQMEISKESEIVNMILDDSAMKKKNEGSLVDLEGELAAPGTVSPTSPTVGTDDKMADGDRIDQTVVSAEADASSASNASKPDDAYLQVYLGPEAYNAGFYI